MPRPEGFWWGTGASSNQAEGAAPQSTWARWEKLGKVPPSGEGNGFATNYRDDFARLAEGGLTHHRLSLEWARLEPREGHHDRDAIEHYRDMLQAAREVGLNIWVTLHHFTLPGWFGDDMKGFADDRGVSYYWPRHVDFVAETFGDLVFGWKPVNEPHAYALLGYLAGSMPPGKRDTRAFDETLEATHLANHAAWKILGGHGQPVATIHNLSPFFPVNGADPAKIRLIDNRTWGCWIGALRDGILQVGRRPPIENEEFTRSFDLVGFSYYNAASIDEAGHLAPYPRDLPVSAMGYVPWAEGIRYVIDRLADELPGRDLLVCETGIGTDNDEDRCRFITDAIGHVDAAIEDGAPVKGFFHWTAVDNYEWNLGFDVRFGVIDRDRNPKPSFDVLSRYATGGLP